jgi:hypothetical protein
LRVPGRRIVPRPAPERNSLAQERALPARIAEWWAGGVEVEVITYEKHFSLSEALMASEASRPVLRLDAGGLAEGATPRLWYMAPQSELAGLLAAAGR